MRLSRRGILRSSRGLLIRTSRREREWTFRLRKNRIAIRRGCWMNPEVPYTQVHLTIRKHFQQSVFAERERLARRQLHPVAPGKNLDRGFHDILLLLHAAQQADLER